MYITKDNFKHNNFNAIQFFMSVLVIYSHAFSIGNATETGEIIKMLTDSNYSAGRIAVATLFIVSGFLVSASYENSRSAVQFFKNRIFRIFPALIAVVAASVFILGPCVSTLPVKDYFQDPGARSYLKNVLLYPIRWSLPGVFGTNAYPYSVNGSLWTLPHQFTLYIMLGVLGFLGLLRHKNMSLACFALFAFAHITRLPGGEVQTFLGAHGVDWGSFLYLGMYFSAGMAAYAYRDQLCLTKKGAMTATVLLLFAWFVAKEYLISMSLFGTYIILCLAYCTKPLRFGVEHLSFGLYIYGFPVQQTITFLFGGRMNPWLNMVIALPVALLCAWLSHVCVEQPALKIKKYFTVQKLIPKKVFTLWDKLYAKWLAVVDYILCMHWILFGVLVCGFLAMVLFL